MNSTFEIRQSKFRCVRTAFESRTIRIPSDDQIRADLRSVRKETTSTGSLRFGSDRGPNGHSDRFWALALALHAKRGYPEGGGAMVV